MEFSDDEVLNFIEEKLNVVRVAGERLSNIERALLVSAWRAPRRTYREIAETEGYSQSYVHNVAADLWEDLSRAFDTKIRKPSLKATISSSMLRDRQSPSELPSEQPIRHDFGNWMGSADLLGRDDEQQQLTEYLSANQARIVGVTGITGIGKSCLCEAVVRRLANQFSVILCRSLRSQIPFHDVLSRWLYLLEPENHSVTSSSEDMLQIVLQLMQQQRCLLILDDFDAIVQDGYMAQQETVLYQQFLQRVSQLAAGCVLVISRTNTELLNLSFWQQAQHLFLSALAPEISQQLMAQHGALPPAPLLDDIQTYYAHHPHYLTAVARQVHHPTVAGRWQYFWDSLSSRLLQGVHHCLKADYNHLNSIEQDVMHWLVIAAKPLSIEYLQSHLSRSNLQPNLIHAVAKLCDRAFIQSVNGTVNKASETSDTNEANQANDVPRYAPTAIWRDFILQHLLHEMVEELYAEQFHLLHHLPIRSVQDPAVVIQQQQDQLVKPILQRLKDRYGSLNQLKQRLKALLDQVCTRQLDVRSHTAGNLINFCQAAGVSFNSLDFSDLDIRNADFRQVSLWNCIGNHTRLRNCGFTIPLADRIALALDATGQHLAVGESNGQITVWQVETATPIQIFHDAEVCCLAFHPQQPILACGTVVGSVCLWHWQSQSNSTVIVRKIHDAAITTLAFAADGEILAIGDRSGRIMLWSAPFQTNSTLQELSFLSELSSLSEIPFLSEQQSDCQVDRQVDRQVERQAERQTAIRHLTWSDDSQRLAVSDSYTGLVWDRATNTTHPVSASNIGRIRSLIFEDNYLYAAISDRTSLWLWRLQPAWLFWATVEEEATITSVHLWRTQTASQSIYLAYIKDDQLILKTINSELEEVIQLPIELSTPLAVSGDGQRLAVMPSARSIQLWQMPTETGSTASIIQHWMGYSCPVQAYTFDPTAQLLAVGNRDGSVRVWDLDAVRCRHVFQVSHTRMRAIALSPDSQHLASSDLDGHLWLWNLATDQSPQLLEGHRHEINALAFHPAQPQLASGSTSGTIRLWHSARGTTQHTFRHPVGITHLIFSPDGQYLMSGDRQGLVCVWDLDTNQLLTSVQAHDGTIEHLGFMPSGQLISAGRDHTVRRWDDNYQTATVLFQDADFYISHVTCISDQSCWLVGWQVNSDSQSANTGRYAQIVPLDLSTHVQQPNLRRITLPFLRNEEQLFFTPHCGIASLQLGDRFQLWERIDLQATSIHSQPDVDVWLNSPYQGFRLTDPECLSPEQIELLRRLGVVITGYSVS
ncbi:MAG: AAA family ATPase [Thainema sp.]